MNSLLLFEEFKEKGIQNIPDGEVESIVVNPEKAKKGSVFISLKKGAQAQNEISQSLNNGALIAISEERSISSDQCLQVLSVRRTFSSLSAKFFSNPEREFERIFAVTGTNGKTSTSYMIYEIWRKYGKSVALIGTVGVYANGKKLCDSPKQMTTPDPFELFSILRTLKDMGVEVLVLEASSHSLYFDKLYPIHFNAGIFTNLTSEHMDFHKNMEEYFEAKLKLFSQCDKGFYNIDDKFARRAFEKKPSPENISFSIEDINADFVAKNIRIDEKGVRFECLSLGSIFRITYNTPGLFNIYNALSAAALCLSEGVDRETVANALFEIAGVKGRLQRVGKSRVFIDYAHTPDALQNAISAINGIADKEEKVYVLFGCGGDRDKEKRPLMGAIATDCSDFVIITSDNPRNEERNSIIADILKGVKKYNYIVVPKRKEAIIKALSMMGEKDYLLLAGKGHEKYEKDKDRLLTFDEEEIVLEYIKKEGLYL